jgi:hypothetical protein
MVKREDWIFLSMFIVAFAAIFILQDRTAQRLDETQLIHCEMVGIYLKSNGEFGWPDYNSTAQYCPALELPQTTGEAL